jgi:hypothetical protein
LESLWFTISTQFQHPVLTMKPNMLLLCLLVCLAVAPAVNAAVKFDQCNICRAPNVVNNKNAKINAVILGMFGLNNVYTCEDLDILGQTGLIPENACVLIQVRPSIRRACVCGPPGTPFATPSPRNKPTKLPTKQPQTMKPKVPTTKKPSTPSAMMAKRRL